MTLEIKLCTSPDTLAILCEQVQTLHHEIRPDVFKPYDRATVAEFYQWFLEKEGNTAFVAYVNDAMAGYVLLSELHRKENCFKHSEIVVMIDQICVLESARGEGIGKALVERVKKYAKDKEIARIEMNYWTRNPNSGEFFGSQGFKSFNERMYCNVD